MHDWLLTSPQVICSCGQVIYEIDMMNCSCCGDVMCEDCYTNCFDCGKMFCHNCSESSTQCLKCNLNSTLKASDEKAFLVINGVTTPIKNSAFMIHKSSLNNARDIRLILEGVEYQYIYRALHQRKDNEKKFDYFLYFEEVKKDSDKLAEKNKESMRFWNEKYGYDDYDDYGNLGW
jgi:hypothetical protein